MKPSSGVFAMDGFFLSMEDLPQASQSCELLQARLSKPPDLAARVLFWA